MNIGMIDKGSLGSALSTASARAGHHVLVSSTNADEAEGIDAHNRSA